MQSFWKICHRAKFHGVSPNGGFTSQARNVIVNVTNGVILSQSRSSVVMDRMVLFLHSHSLPSHPFS